MNDLFMHLVLFLVASAAIVALGAFYSDPDDRRALRSLPRRLATFIVGCAVLTALILICEHTLASVR